VTIDPINSGTLAHGVAKDAAAAGPATNSAQAFGELLHGSLAELGDRLNAADGALQAYAAGEPIAVHDLVIAMEQARVSLQFAVEVRNKAVEAYQELMRMQV